MPQPACIRHTDLPGTSKLFADFSYHFDRVRKFYTHDPHKPTSYVEVAAELKDPAVYPDERRAALVAALRGQNGESETLRRLSQPGTVAVVTGQQVGLFGGPAYTIYKALTAVRVAQQLTQKGISAVPVFWLATEDHDFAEVDHAWVFGADGAPYVLRVTADAGKQRPVGPVAIANFPIDELRENIKGLPYADEVIAAVTEAYPPGTTMGAGCHALLKKILANQGMLFLDPLDPAIRAIGAPFMVEALNAAADLRALLTERNRELNDAGYHAQVHVDAKTSLFFLLEKGERVTLRMKDAEYAQLADRAAHVSPNALLRPVWQDYLLPTVTYVGGPGELAYLAQSAVIYQRLLGHSPVAAARSGFTILDAKSVKLLDRFRMTVAQVFTSEEDFRERVADALVPAGVGTMFEKTSVDVTRQIRKLQADLNAFDPTLATAMTKSGAKIIYQIEKMRRKTEREALRRDERASADAERLANLIYPHRHPQERFYSILPFLAQYGLDFIDRLGGSLEADCPDHRVYFT